MLRYLYRTVRWCRLVALRRRGLQIAEDCRLMGMPNFGSEPFLVSIGEHVTIAGNVTFVTHDGGTWVLKHDPRCQEVLKYGRIVIHDNCFIGQGSVLMPGVSIGPNAVVGVSSIVTRDVEAGTVACGVPARTIMTIQEYADRCVADTPDYSRTAYRRDKKSELLRLFPRPW